MKTKRGKIYLGFLVGAGICLVLAPFLPWSYYYLQLSGGSTPNVYVFTTGLGSLFASSQIGNSSYSFPSLQNWSLGTLALVIGILTFLISILTFYRAEDGGLIAFILSFINMPPSLFFLGRSQEIANIVGVYITWLGTKGISVTGFVNGFAIGYLIDLIGTILLPASSIYIVATATKLRTTTPKRKKIVQPPQDEETSAEN